mgnify:FL=1
MSFRQREVAAAIEERSGGGLSGPYAAMLYSPEMADRAQRLGEFLRCGLRIPERLRILAVLVAVGRHRSEDIFAFVSLDSVLNSTLARDKIQALSKGQPPQDMTEDEAVVYAFSSELARNGHVKNVTYDMLVSKLGRGAALELVGVCGYTSMLTNVINITQSSISRDGVAELV